MEYVPPKRAARVPLFYAGSWGDYVETPSDTEPGTYDSVYVPVCRNCGKKRDAHAVNGSVVRCLFDFSVWKPTTEEDLHRFEDAWKNRKK